MPELDVKFVVTSTERGEPQLALLLEGLTDLPPDPRFSILPADDSRALELGPAPEDLNAPCSVTREAHGIVLGVGDHIGERLRLRPGQTVVVELPGIGVRTIAEWPGHLTQHVPAPAMPTEAPPPVSDHEPVEVAGRPLAAALAETLRQIEQRDGADDTDREDPSPAASDEANVSRLRPPASAVKLEEAQQRLSSIVSRIMSYEPAEAPAPKAAPAVPPPIASAFRAIDDKMSAAEIAATVAAAAAAAEQVDSERGLTHDDVAAPAAPVASLASAMGLPRVAAAGPSGGAVPPRQDEPEGDAPSSRREYPIAKYEGTEEQVDVVGRRMSFAALVLAACSSVIVLIGVVWMSTQTRTIALAKAEPQRPGTIRLAGGSAEVAGGTAQGPSLTDVFAIGPTSPLGRARRDISLESGLALADQSLTKSTSGERAEGEYWLRHALSIALGDERIRWALTQLGSGYAGGSGDKPDYAKARLLWEIAGQLGDPVALCFLGTLYEHGLGVSADKPQALAWYSRAKQVGGCPGIDASIARVRQ